MTRLALADVLRQGLAPGATVDTLAIVDIYSLSAILESLVPGYEDVARVSWKKEWRNLPS
jgi:hypothetical protein